MHSLQALHSSIDSVVVSEGVCGRRPCRSMRPIRSTVYSRNRMERRTEPCRTPNRSLAGRELAVPTRTYCVLRTIAQIRSEPTESRAMNAVCDLKLAKQCLVVDGGRKQTSRATSATLDHLGPTAAECLTDQLHGGLRGVIGAESGLQQRH
jgi:hypothetical protein